MSDIRRKLLSLKKTISKINILSKAKSRELAESEFKHNKIALDHYKKKIAEMGTIDDNSPKATQLRYSTLKQALKDAESKEEALVSEHPDLIKPKVSNKSFVTDNASSQQLENKTLEEFSSMRDDLDKETARRDRSNSSGDTKTKIDAEKNIEEIQNKIDVIPMDSLHRELSRHKESMDPNLPKNKPLFDKHQEKTRRLEDQINRLQSRSSSEIKEKDTQLDNVTNQAYELNESDSSKNIKENKPMPQQDDKQQLPISQSSVKSPVSPNPLEQWKASKQNTQQVPKVEEVKVDAPKLNPFEQWKAKKTTEIKKSQINKLENKITDLSKAMSNSGIGGVGSVKAGAVLPNKVPKGPKIGHNSLASKVKIPSVTNQSKKDPMRSIQQIQNKDIKDLKMKEAAAALVPVVKFEKNGQWSLDKADELPPPIPEEARSQERERASDGRTPGPQYWEYPDSEQSNTPKSTIDRWNDEAEANYVKRKKEAESQQKEPLAASRTKNIKDKLEKFKKRCWKGYEPTPGKKAYSEGSCQPIKKQECGCESKTEKECGCD